MAKSPEAKKLQLEAYKLLVGMAQQEETFFWRRSEFFIVINGGLFSALGLILPKDGTSGNHPLNFVPVTICVVGVVLCLLWLFTAARGEAFFNLWNEQLKYLEQTYLSPIKIYRNADKYFIKGRIKLGKEEFKLNFLARWIKITHALEISSVIFSLVWVVLAVYLVIQ